MKYDREGQRISMARWTELFEDPDYRVVAQELVADRWWVSTVWLGLDHGFDMTAAPIIFETMVFDHGRDAEGAARFHDLEQERYSTETDARLGHERMVQLVATLEGIEVDRA